MSRSAEARATAWACAKWTLVGGVLQMLCCCVWGALRDLELNHWDNKFVGAHHQFAHNGELLIACAAAFPVLALSRPALLAAFVALQAGTWANPIAYVIMTVSGESMPSDAKHGGLQAPTGPWGVVTERLLFGICAPGMVIGLALLLVGVLRNKDLAASVRLALGLGEAAAVNRVKAS